MLWQNAQLNELRLRHRSGNTKLYDLLVDVYKLSLQRSINAIHGNEARQNAASEEREYWTVRQLATATGRAERTIRLDIASNTLPATKSANAWLITNTAARTYINTHHKS